uniref:Pyruvate kinase n=2 Tax=Clastoptera arizonana TaxID=38151 RepID=A0A1B6DBL5_9HEMI
MSSLPITVMPWHKPDPCMPPKMQTPAAFKSSYLEYMSNLSIESKLLRSPLSVIMCTIGPSTNNQQSLISLMESGMSFALVQMSSGSREEVQDTIQLLQSAVSENSIAHDRVVTLATAVQLKPPGVHIGTLDRGRTVTLQAGDTFTLTTNSDWKYRCNSKFCYFDLPNAGDILNREDEIIVGNGGVRLIVDEVANNNITCNVTQSGQLLSNMKVSIPGVPLHLGAVTEQDKDDLAFISLQSNVDAVVVTSTKSAIHIIEIRRLLKSNGSDLRVLARIDSKSGIDNLNEIAREADGVVLARNELAAEIEVYKLLLSQKIAFATCNKIGKPVFVCAEYMESMLHLKNPKFSEIIDVQSAILDGADGVLLEAVTAEGHFADQAVKVVASSFREAEAAVWQNQIFDSLLLLAMPPMDPAHAISIGAVDTALKSCASAIILATTSGRAAQIVSRYRPRCPIIAVTRYGRVARQLNMWRAVISVHYISQPFPDWNKEVDVRLQMGIELGKEKKNNPSWRSDRFTKWVAPRGWVHKYYQSSVRL